MAKIEFYFDEMMPREVVKGLSTRGITVTMAVDVEMVEKDDLADHLTYSTQMNAVLVTCDKSFATRALSESHAGVICWTGAQDDFGGMVRRLTEFSQVYASEQVVNRVFWLK